MMSPNFKNFLHLDDVIIAIFFAVIGYFAPISGVITVLIIAMLADLVVGIAASRKRGLGIKVDKLYRTISKMFYSVLLVTLLYAIDNELKIVDMHKIVAWVIIGFEIWSFIGNASFLVDHPALKAVQKLMKHKMKDIANIDMDDYDDTAQTDQNKKN